MKKLSIIFLLFLLLTTGNLTAQNFEYALTQQPLEGAKINDILVIEDRVYLAGGSKDGGSPLIIVFDTSGQLIDYREFIPDTPERLFGYIMDLRYDSTTSLIQAIAYAATGCDGGPDNVYRWLFDKDLQKQAELEFPPIIDFTLSHPTVHFSDSILSLSANGKTKLYDNNFKLFDEIDLPKDLYFPVVIIHQNELLVFNIDHAEIIYRLNMDGDEITAQNIAQANQIEFFGQSLIAAGTDGILRRYNSHTLFLTDSLEIANTALLELHQVSDEVLEIVWHQKDGRTLAQLYDTDLKLIEDIDLAFSDEYKIVSTITDSQFLYHVSSENKINYIAATQGLVPVLRKIKLASAIKTIDRPAIKIVDVQITDLPSYYDCVDLFGDEACSVYDDLHYAFTVENTGDIAIDNFGQYVSSVFHSFCGGFIQNYRYFDNFTLLPGERMTFTDSVSLGLIFNAPDLKFYVVGPNHFINAEEDATYTFENLSTSQKQINDSETLSLYPNPAQDILMLNNKGNVKLAINGRLEILTMAGQRIEITSLNEEGIDVSDLVPGMYIIRIRNTEKTFLGSFIKTD